MIASCPFCGTHYKHEAPVAPVRARCGRCATSIDLSGLRPYRIVAPALTSTAEVLRERVHLPAGYDQPTLAATPAGAPFDAAPVASWDHRDPMPSPVPYPEWHEPELARAESEPPAAGDRRSWELGPDRRKVEESILTTLGLGSLGGAVLCTGASWMLGGSTSVGVTFGSLAGFLVTWMWLRWADRR